MKELVLYLHFYLSTYCYRHHSSLSLTIFWITVMFIIFISFFSTIRSLMTQSPALGRTFHTMLNRRCESGRPCLYLGGKTFIFAPPRMTFVGDCQRPLLSWGLYILYPLCWEFLLGIDVEFGQVILVPLLRWSHDFYPSFCYCAISCPLISR